MRGREREWRAVLGLLRAARRGKSGVLLLDGEPGMGRSRFLAEAADAATSRRFSLAVGQSEEFGQLVPMAPLLAAFNQSPITPADETLAIDTPLALVERLRIRAEALASANPVAVILDDLQWADPTTLKALRTLQSRLTAQPLVWLLARNTVNHGTEAERLFSLLESEGGIRLELGPLPPDAVTEVAADFLAAAPGRDVLELAAGAGGNPHLLVELLTGLQEEQAIHVSGGLTHLVSGRLPRRLQRLVARRLERLSGQARQLVETAAVLGRPFSPEDMAKVLGRTPAALLPALEEAMDADLLTVGPDSLHFRHALVRRAIAEGLPTPLRQALHHQLGGLLTETPAAAARTTEPTSPRRLTHTLKTAQAMIEAGRLGEATELVTSTLAQPLPPQVAAQLHGELSAALVLSGQAAGAVTEAEAALAEPELPDAVRDRAHVSLLQALAGQQDSESAVRRAASILEEADRHGDAVVVTALTILAADHWDRGRLTDGLDLAREAVRRADEGSGAARRTHPHLAMASMLLDVGRLDEAEILLRTAREEVETLGHIAWAAGPAVLHARFELAGHRVVDAVAGAEAGLATADSLGTHLFTSLGMAVLGAAALRRGDLQEAAAHMEGDRAQGSHYGPTQGRLRCLMLSAQVMEARGQPRKAMALLSGLYPMLDRHRGLLIVEPTAAAWLVRLALSVGDRPRAESVVAAAGGLADDNPAFSAVLAAAAHARGLLDKDVSAVAVAVAAARDDYARASAREDLGAALASTGERDAAIRVLDDALAGFEATGAVRDSARVRRRLRLLGVRHRHWSREQGAALGWGSLTATQRAVARLVARGLTNRQAADQMFISVHTVAFHLRQIFRKLDIDSRVDLTRFIEIGRAHV